LGILLTKFINRLLLALSLDLLTLKILDQYEFKYDSTAPLIIFLIYISYFPGPFPLSNRSILSNLKNKFHAWNLGHSNELFRAYSNETTAPLLFLSLYCLLDYLDSPSMSTIIMTLLCIVLLLFTIVPLALVYSFVCVAQIYLQSNSWKIIFLIILINVIYLMFYWKSTKEDVYSKSLFKIVFSRKIINPNLRLNYYQFLFLGLYCWINYFIFESKYNNLISLIISFILFSLFVNLSNHLSRFWLRGAEVAFQYLMIVITYVFIYDLTTIFLNLNFKNIWIVFENIVSILLIISLVVALIIFYIVQYLGYKIKNSFSISQEELEIFKQEISKVNEDTIATSSFEIANMISMYSNRRTVFVQYTLQNKGYIDQIKRVVENFKILNYTYDEFAKMMTLNVDSSVWIQSMNLTDEIKYKMNCHTLQLWCTYREYNLALIQDEMYASGWTQKYIELLTNLWNNNLEQ
jgi:hypothetical protein